MTLTITTLISDELTGRLQRYQRLIATATDSSREELRTELNHRYLCLQMAYYMAGGTKQPPAIQKELDDVHDELRRWMRDIQRNSRKETMIVDGRCIALITELIEQTKPITALPEQTRLI